MSRQRSSRPGRFVLGLVGLLLFMVAVMVASRHELGEWAEEADALAFAAKSGLMALSTDHTPIRKADPSAKGSGLSPEARMAGADESWWKTVSTAIENEDYAASVTEQGLTASNRSQNLLATFDELGVELAPRTDRDVAPPWRFAWQTTGFGRPDRIEEVSSSSPSAVGARVFYEREGWSEWYENTPKGVEQGFTIEDRPAGEGPLRIAGTFPAEFMAQSREDGGIDFIDKRQACAIRYGELHVWDAKGADLSARLEVAGNQLAILIEDEDAVYPITVDPLMTSPAWTAESNQTGASLGISASTAGDVNGDGFSDVVVGAYEYDNPAVGEGRAFVYHGSASGLSVVPAWTAQGNQFNAHFGYSAGTAGDVNGDGFDDVIVSAFAFDNGELDEGKAWVFHGSATGLQNNASWSAEGNQESAVFGISVATAGDVNGDGFDDVIVGAYLFDNGQTDEGRAFAYYGSASGLSPVANWTAEANQAVARFGNSVATAGDVNGDGYDEVLVGANLFDNGQVNEGRAYLYQGSSSGLSASVGWSVESDQADAQLGAAVATAGDMNGDGYADVIVGAHGYDLSGSVNEGVALVYRGAANGLSTVSVLLRRGQPGAFFGYAVGTAGDVNGDGFSDVIVGAFLYDNGQVDEGGAFGFFGSPFGVLLAPAWEVDCNQASANFGVAMGTAGDVNGDGFSDVIVGAYLFDNGLTDEGSAFVYHGAAAGLAISPGWTAESNVGGDYAWKVATAGDVNGDGFSDVIVSAETYSNGESMEGRAFVYHGSGGGLSTAPDWIAESNQANARFGSSVAGAGDVNGDGFSDVIVGALNYHNGETEEGRAFVYYGSSAGLALTAGWTAESNQVGALFGHSVATVGDVNGDGFSDVIVGAFDYDNGQADEGAAFVYHGSAAGLAMAAAWSGESNQANAFFGFSVGPAGDVNGDGFSDVIVGAIDYENGQLTEGRAFAYHGSATGLATSPAWSAEGNQVAGDFGFAVATAGDVNADGFSDVIIGAYPYDNGQTDEGMAFVYHGSAGGLAASPAWTAESNQVGAGFGYSVATAGDANGDGFSDVIIASVEYTNGQIAEGQAIVYHGSAGGLLNFAAWTVETNQPFAVLTGVSTAGDVNGDGFSDVIVGSPHFDNGHMDEGRAFLYYGNKVDGPHRIARQVRTDDSAPIWPLGNSDSESAFRLNVLGRTPAGRGNVRLQFEVKPAGTPFDGTSLVSGAVANTGTPGAEGSAVPLSELASGLTPETLYHWRLRVISDSPFFPHTPWMWLPYNAVTEADVRTSGEITAVAEVAGNPAAGLWLGPGTPNPFNPRTTLSFLLPAQGKVRLAIHDVQGRLVRVLVEEVRPAGGHAVEWDGRDGQGHELATGVYMSRLEAGGEVRSQKLTLVK